MLVRLGPLKYSAKILARVLIAPILMSGRVDYLAGEPIPGIGITETHEALSEIVPEVNEVLGRNFVKLPRRAFQYDPRRWRTAMKDCQSDDRRSTHARTHERERGREEERGEGEPYQTVNFMKDGHTSLPLMLWMANARHVGKLGIILHRNEPFPSSPKEQQVLALH